jgi:hypothetical protein
MSYLMHTKNILHTAKLMRLVYYNIILIMTAFVKYIITWHDNLYCIKWWQLLDENILI